MNHDAFRAAWLDALQAIGLRGYPDRGEDLIDLGTMCRKHSLRVGMGHEQVAEPFFVTMLLGWTWTPVHSARTYTNEEDLLSELLGHEQARAVLTERPWVRVDVQLHATLPWGQPLRLEGADRLHRWTGEVTRALQPMLRSRVERNSAGIEAIHASIREPQARVECGGSGELLLLGVEVEAWRGVQLPRTSDVDDVLEDDTAPQLARLATDAGAALAAWTRSLALLLRER